MRLNAFSGAYTYALKVCEDHIFKALSGAGRWVVVALEAWQWGQGNSEDMSEHAFICHLETGEMRDIVPPGYDFWASSCSPDNEWLVLAGDRSGERKYDIFAYHPPDDRWVSLGSLDDESLGFGEWVSAHQGILAAGSLYAHDWEASHYYAFDVTQPNSLTPAFYAWRDDHYFGETPARYVSIMSEKYSTSMAGGSGPDHSPCQLVVYDAEGIRRHDLAYECLPMAIDESRYSPFFRHGNTLYYLATASKDATVSELRVFDLDHETGSVQLFTGEIESILSVSPDQRYIVLLMDDNGMLDTPFETCCKERGGWQTAIFDQKWGAVVYRSEPIGVYLPGQVAWMDAHTVLIGAVQELAATRVSEENDYIYEVIPPSIRRITFDETYGTDITITTHFGLLTRFPAIFPLQMSPDRHAVIVETAVIDPLTFEKLPILRDDIPESYRVSLRWAEDGALVTRIDSESNGMILYRAFMR